MRRFADHIRKLDAAHPTHHPVAPISNDVINFPVPEMFASADKKVIVWAGESYYKACGEFVATFDDGSGGSTTSHCLKREGHPGKLHEDFDGRTRSEYEYDFSEMELEQAIFEALGAASACWENLSGAGIFESDKCKAIGDALVKRVNQAGPIYG